MDYLQNHIWCSESNWDGIPYDCRHLVGLNSYGTGYKEDWEVLTEKDAERVFDQESYDDFTTAENGKYSKYVRNLFFCKSAPTLKPEVLKWLEDNVKDRKDAGCPKGWCIGSAKYRSNNHTTLTVFFHRKSDAMAFVRTFSKWKKPIRYTQYFSDVRKILNLKTGRYQ